MLQDKTFTNSIGFSVFKWEKRKKTRKLNMGNLKRSIWSLNPKPSGNRPKCASQLLVGDARPKYNISDILTYLVIDFFVVLMRFYSDSSHGKKCRLYQSFPGLEVLVGMKHHSRLG